MGVGEGDTHNAGISNHWNPGRVVFAAGSSAGQGADIAALDINAPDINHHSAVHQAKP